MIKRFKKLRKSAQGFSLAEVLIATMILVATVTGILSSYLRCMQLNEVSQGFSIAVRAAKTRMETIRSTNFGQVTANFNNVSFPVSGIDARGVSYVDASNPALLQITVSVSWKTKNGRSYGEDINLNGNIDAGEDVNGNGRLDSPASIVTRIYQRI